MAHTIVRRADKYAYVSGYNDDYDRNLYSLFEDVITDLTDQGPVIADQIDENVLDYLNREIEIFTTAVTDLLPDPADKIDDIIDRLKDLLNIAQSIKDSIKKQLSGGVSGVLDVLNEIIEFYKAMSDSDSSNNRDD